jgi:hypothetical protein
MKCSKNKNIHFSYKWIISAFYIFLLSLQCSDRFYSISTYYLLSPRGLETFAHPDFRKFPSHQEKKDRDIHLSLDKRFNVSRTYTTDFLKDAVEEFSITAFIIKAQSKFYSFHERFINRPSYSTSLRGPPCA